ncbi:hypothetical protein Pryu01_00635 [Paraliobacillus ryukyuensis]|uniref:Uncharacterized protein n=1 Tax=Paraliobacillus ryukyuensis TaxID=200904 RepID=A0A366EIL3_9BACI|nr:hypothetical protein DES48_10127 [Paraliobacillus ryukyuensis]
MKVDIREHYVCQLGWQHGLALVPFMGMRVYLCSQNLLTTAVIIYTGGIRND